MRTLATTAEGGGQGETATPATAKGQRRRDDIVAGAAEILREQGPQAVSHRAVARRAGCSLSATTYYFSGLDELLSEAGRHNIARWAARAEAAAEAAEAAAAPATGDQAIDLVLRATLPTDEEMLGHYRQLVAAGGSPPVRDTYRTGRDRLNAAVNRVLRRADFPWSAETVIAVVDGACVSALSEGRDVPETARGRLWDLLASDPPDGVDSPGGENGYRGSG